MKNLILFFIILFFLLPKISFAQEKATVDFYWKEDCRYCEKEQKFLDRFQKEQLNLVVNSFEVSKNPGNVKRLITQAAERNINPNSVPITFVGKQTIIGFDSDETTGEQIKNALKNSDQEYTLNGQTCDLELTQCQNEDKTISIPLLGKTNLKSYSLPILTVILGLADGFNPCAMWALLALIGLLVGLGSRQKLIIIGGAFLLASYIIYVVFMAAWLNVFLYLGYIRWVQIAVGAAAVLAGANYLRDFLRTDSATCKITKAEKRNSVIARIKKIVAHDWLPISLVGVVALAVAVNAIEALCSAGIPAVFTKTLTEAGLSKSQYYGYIGAYNIFYMADDIIVFGLAVATRNIIHFNPKYRYFGLLAGGLVLTALGIVFIIKPELLSLK